MVICSICATPVVRGYVDADLVRHRALRAIAKCHGLSIRSVRRHLLHLPELLETESSTGPRIYIGTVTNNFNVVVASPEEEDGQEELGSIANEGGGG
jgi:hypothetical protein